MKDELIKFSFSKAAQRILIKVVGVGGGGGNAVTDMFNEDVKGVSYALCNTDIQPFISSHIDQLIQLGEDGTGAGADPEVARLAAEESAEELKQLFEDGTKMAFITATMGGGTGTGAAPVVARIAKEKGLLTVGIVTIPFLHELKPKIMKALNGVIELAKHVDALIVINNQRLLDLNAKLSVKQAYKEANNVLVAAAKGISEIITIAGEMNLDFADVRTTLKQSGIAIISNGFGNGEERLKDAFNQALNSPFTNNNKVPEAKRILYNIYANSTCPILIEEMSAVNDFMGIFGSEVEVIWGMATDENLEGDTVRVTVLAAGYGLESLKGVVDRTMVAVEELPITNLSDEELAAQEKERQKVLIALENLYVEHYGNEHIPQNATISTGEPYILKDDEWSNSAVFDALEAVPVYKRNKSFKPLEFKPEKKTAKEGLF
jgi:cell division protein FtsZ